MKRSDKARNVDKVIAEIVKNPLQSIREIAEDTGLGKSTVARALIEVGQNGTKDDRIVALTDLDFDLTYVSVKELKRRAEETPDKVTTGEFIAMARESGVRFSRLVGDITDGKGGLRPINIISYADASTDDTI
jgi:DNA-binding MurR/RpiR family transcriptional regulator